MIGKYKDRPSFGRNSCFGKRVVVSWLYNILIVNVLENWNIIGFGNIWCIPICKIQYVFEFNKIQHYYDETSTRYSLFLTSIQLSRI